MMRELLVATHCESGAPVTWSKAKNLGVAACDAETLRFVLGDLLQQFELRRTHDRTFGRSAA
jgi:hypothetical protein